MTKKAIVTLAIGAAYAERFERSCRRNWTAYCERHGFDLVVITEPLDTSARARQRSPAWQKCLILGANGLADYERVVWVDSDIVLNPAAPSVVDGVPIERIGVTDEHTYPTPEARQAILGGIIAASPEAPGLGGKSYWTGWRDAGAWHAALGLPGGQRHIVQTGVMVMSPKHHREMLEHVYHAYEDGGCNYEMRFLSHEILSRDLQHWLDPRFNALVWWLFLQANTGSGRVTTQADIQRFLTEIHARNYFLHFAGCAHLMPLVDF
ncbi:MAG TPA: hypothetical protein VHT51_09275 [Micropepsaceae bacterium]|nr:hypothetical protein [Micropepsaceae bacterium]